jgi:hypothetical protein
LDDIYKFVVKFLLPITNCVLPGVVQTSTVSISIIIIIIIIIIMFVIYKKSTDEKEVHSVYLYEFMAYLIGHDQVVVVVVIVPDDNQLNKLKYVVEI